MTALAIAAIFLGSLYAYVKHPHERDLRDFLLVVMFFDCLAGFFWVI